MEVVQYKCPNCGGNLEYQADQQNFGCEYCLSRFTEAEIKEIFNNNENINLDENVAEKIVKEEQEFEEHTNLYSCPNCGAEIMAEDTTSATFCYYCHNPVILTGRLSGDYKPSKIIPFNFDKHKTEELFKQWCKKKWFLPDDFKSNQQLEKMAGVYVPFWIANCTIKANMNAIGKKTRSWVAGNYKYTETKEFSVIRRASVFMEGIPADGSSKIDDKLMEAIEPFNYDELKSFSMSFLSGFFADKYDVDKSEVFPRIKNRAVDGCDRLIRSTMTGYSSLHVTNSDISILKTDWNYILLPVWFMTYKYKDKSYSFVINGQTYKLAGKPPLSIPKLLRFCGILTAILTLILTIGGYFFS